MKVWVVISGCHSDQSLAGVFSTREKARDQATAACSQTMDGKLYRDRARVVEVEVDDDDGFFDSDSDRCERFDSDSQREDKSVVGTPLEND